MDLLMDSTSSDSEDDVIIKKRVYRPRINFDLDAFTSRFRLTRTAVEEIIQNIGYRLQHDTDQNFALSPIQQLLLAFRYVAGGGFMLTIGDAHGPAKSTVSRSVHAVVSAINDFYFQNTVKWPENVDSMAAKFYKLARMPCCVGAIDGSHVPIKAPSADDDEPQYVNRHSDHSINTMMVAGPDCRFYYVSSKWPGSVSDARILCLSTLARKFETGWRPMPNGILLGDSGYGLSEWLIPPLRKPQLTAAEERFNRSHRSTRRIVECAFGILKMRFACLQKLRLDPKFASEVIKTCTILHNISIQHTLLDQEEIDEIMREIALRDDGLEIEAAEDNNVNGNVGRIRQAELINFFR